MKMPAWKKNFLDLVKMIAKKSQKRNENQEIIHPRMSHITGKGMK